MVCELWLNFFNRDSFLRSREQPTMHHLAWVTWPSLQLPIWETGLTTTLPCGSTDITEEKAGRLCSRWMELVLGWVLGQAQTWGGLPRGRLPQQRGPWHTCCLVAVPTFPPPLPGSLFPLPGMSCSATLGRSRLAPAISGAPTSSLPSNQIPLTHQSLGKRCPLPEALKGNRWAKTESQGWAFISRARLWATLGEGSCLIFAYPKFHSLITFTISPMFEDHLYFKFLNTFSNQLPLQKLEKIIKMLFITVSEELVSFAINSNIKQELQNSHTEHNVKFRHW